MKRFYLFIGAVAVAVLLSSASSASAATVTTTKDCYKKTLLLSGSCTVVYNCPTTADFCIARGDVTVQATQVTGVKIKGDVWVVSPPGPVPAGATTASCGGTLESGRRCSATAPLLQVKSGDAVHVACSSNRTFPALGLLWTETFCRGTFGAVTN